MNGSGAEGGRLPHPPVDQGPLATQRKAVTIERLYQPDWSWRASTELELDTYWGYGDTIDEALADLAGVLAWVTEHLLAQLRSQEKERLARQATASRRPRA